MLTRSAHDNKFQILWPERRDFAIEDHEFFEFLEGNRLYTTVWYEDPDYREEVLVRDYETGETAGADTGKSPSDAGRPEVAFGVRRCCIPCG